MTAGVNLALHLLPLRVVQGIADIKNSRGERSSMVGLVEFFTIYLSHGNFSFDKDPLGSKHHRMQKDIIKNIDRAIKDQVSHIIKTRSVCIIKKLYTTTHLTPVAFFESIYQLS